jgi:hypothetical protein
MVSFLSINSTTAKYFANKSPLIALAICCMLLGFLVAGCHKTAPAPARSPKECIDEILARLKELPEKSYLTTLDGQSVDLQEFFDACARKWPHCALYAKFYYWASEVKEIESKSTAGRVRHRARMYYNPLSTCHPEHVNPGRTHGDVVEIYDEDGAFMGLGVYMGDGMYVTLPYSGYKGKRRFSI